MAEDERLIEEARQSREETERMREGVETERSAASGDPGPKVDDSPPDEPWAKTSSGDADEITDDS